MFALALAATACIDKRYDMEKLSTKMAVGGDSLCIPLASTDTIRLGKIITVDSASVLKVNENGYLIEVAGEQSISIDGISLDDIKDQSFSPDPYKVSFADVDLESFSIDGMDQTVKMDMGIGSSADALKDFEIPALSLSKSAGTSMGDYTLSAAQKELSFPKVDLQCQLLKDAYIPSEIAAAIALLGADQDMEVPEALRVVPANDNSPYEFTMDVPQGIGSLRYADLETTPTPTTLTFDIKVDNASTLFTQGSLVPGITIDLGNLFVLADDADVQDGKLILGEGFTLNKANDYKISKTVQATRLQIEKTPVDGQVTISDTVKINGQLTFVDTWFNTKDLDAVKKLSYTISLSVNGMKVKTIVFVVDEFSTPVSGNTKIEMSSQLDPIIKKVENITTKQPSQITFQITSPKIPAELGSNLNIKSLQLAFPKELHFGDQPGFDQATNTLTLTDEAYDPVQGKTIVFELQSIDMSEHALDAENKLIWESNVTYDGTMAFSGEVNSDNLPTDSLSFLMSISSNLEFDQATVETNDYEQDLPDTGTPIDLDIDTDERVKHIGVATLEDGTYLTIDFNLPESPLPLQGDIDVNFPKVLRFGEDSHLSQDNVYRIDGEIPEQIKLKVEALDIDQTLTDGLLSIHDSVVVAGKVTLASGHVSSKDLLDFAEDEISVHAKLDKMTIKNLDVDLNTIEANFGDTVSLSDMSIDIPKEVKHIDSILLGDDACLDLSIDIQNLPDLGTPIVLDFELGMPELIMAEGQGLSQGVWKFSDTLANGKPINHVLRVRGLNLSQEQLEGTYKPDLTMSYKVSVWAENPKVNSSDLQGEDITVSTGVNLKNITINKVFGQFDLGLEAAHESVDLSALPDMLKGEDNHLDIDPVFTLEVHSNISVPVILNGTLTPWINGEAIEEHKQVIELDLQQELDADGMGHTYCWMAATDDGMPEGYTFFRLNLNELFDQIPDSLVVDMGVDSDTARQQEFVLTDSYVADIKYNVSMPLAFGETMRLSVRDTMELDLGDGTAVLDYIGDCVEIFGTIENTLPLNLTTYLIPVDEYYQPLDMDPVKVEISSCKADRTANVSDYDVKLTNKDNVLDDMKAIILYIKLASDHTVAGMAIRPEDYVRVQLKLRVVGGLIIDPSELGEDDNN